VSTEIEFADEILEESSFFDPIVAYVDHMFITQNASVKDAIHPLKHFS
jgi:hypothetical protein